MANDTVLIVTASYDAAADHVVEILESTGTHVFRLNTDLFPSEVNIQFWPNIGTVFDDGNTVVSDRQIKSVWYRRHVAPKLPDHLDPGIRDFCERETRAFLSGIINSLLSNRWMSRPDVINVAEKKPHQLAVASRMGFIVPETIITNNQNVVEGWSKERKLVAKAVSSGYIKNPCVNLAMFTSLVQPGDLHDLGGLKLAPVTFQEHVDKVLDIRVTVVAEDVFAAEILSQERDSSRTDWRATDDPDLGHAEHELPDNVSSRCRALVKKLGLQFGAIDLALTNDGCYMFFEINPNGEWLWIEDRLGYPIAERIALWLANKP